MMYDDGEPGISDGGWVTVVARRAIAKRECKQQAMSSGCSAACDARGQAAQMILHRYAA